MLKPWFLRSKPKITLPVQASDDSGFGRGPLPDDVLADLPWAAEFDSSNPAGRAKLRLILRVSRVKQQTFFVSSATDVQQRKALATFSSFPTSYEVSAAVAEPYGGGAFNIWAALPHPQLLKTYHVQGPIRRPSPGSRQQDRIAEIANEIRVGLLEAGYQYLRDHPEMFAELSLGLLCQEVGVRVPEMPSFEQELLNEAMRDPAFREEEAQRVMASRRLDAKRAAEVESQDHFFRYLKRTKRISELLGLERGAQPNAGARWDEVMKTVLADGGLTDILEAFKNVSLLRNPAQAPQASPDREPPHAEEQPEAETGAHDSQVAEHLPPVTPPQSPAPQEPRVRQKPGDGTGPSRFDIGVPADSLGLLGLRGDTSFVDRPLV